jgi:SAM-dependent methyltransferase
MADMRERLPEIFSKVEQDLKTRGGISDEMLAWSVNYLRNHRTRYISDLKTVSKYHASGEILELGSAPFHFTLMLKELGMEVTGVDIDPDRFAEFIRKNNLSIVKCDVEIDELPFEDESFHMVLFNEVFEHMRINPIQTLKKISRILHPDGYLMLSTPNLYSITTIINFLLGKGFDDPYEQFDKIEKYGHMGHVREYSVSQVRKFLEKTGYELVEVKLQSHSPLKGLWTPFNTVRKIFPHFHAFQTHVCKKA